MIEGEIIGTFGCAWVGWDVLQIETQLDKIIGDNKGYGFQHLAGGQFKWNRDHILQNRAAQASQEAQERSSGE